MLSLNEKDIRASFVNASRKEITDLSLPAEFAELDWQKLDYLGWRDRKIARRAYVVVPVDGQPVGILLRQAEAGMRSRAQCSWCQDVHLPNDVAFYGAKRAGAAGRNGNTVGTLICADFECSANVRKTPPMAYIGFDVEGARADRIASLQERAAAFAAVVRHVS
ncbi:FBP domain-containing protein [Lysinimonas soli]|uniref:FBP domain-containing protein n=1 Tax=Lysinimonas soli TaxID=1074233 RepID=A0ABW0NLM4_9MICO